MDGAARAFTLDARSRERRFVYFIEQRPFRQFLPFEGLCKEVLKWTCLGRALYAGFSAARYQKTDWANRMTKMRRIAVGKSSSRMSAYGAC